jgi:hypothetical protein
VSPRALLGAVVGHLNTVAALLQGSLGLTMRRQLSSVAGETAGLAGWLAYDLEDRRAADAFFRAGIEAAQEAEDRPLGAYLGRQLVRPAGVPRASVRRLHRLQGHTFGFTIADANPDHQGVAGRARGRGARPGRQRDRQPTGTRPGRDEHRRRRRGGRGSTTPRGLLRRCPAGWRTRRGAGPPRPAGGRPAGA